jgi:hypothetical protein
MAATLIAERNRLAIDALTECVEACNACSYHCNLGHETMAECARLCLDCAAICELTHTLLSRGSRWALQMAGLAAQISTECAAECESLGDDDCRQCVASCRTSAARCKELLTA